MWCKYEWDSCMWQERHVHCTVCLIHTHSLILFLLTYYLLRWAQAMCKVEKSLKTFNEKENNKIAYCRGWMIRITHLCLCSYFSFINLVLWSNWLWVSSGFMRKGWSVTMCWKKGRLSVSGDKMIQRIQGSLTSVSEMKVLKYQSRTLIEIIYKSLLCMWYFFGFYLWLHNFNVLVVL